jgi:hypothetical protein
MRWVLLGNFTSAVREALARHGHKVLESSELALAEGAPAQEVLNAAQTKQLDIITNDAALVNAIFDERIRFNRVVVFLQLEGGDVEQDDAIDRLFKRYNRMSPGRLYTVTGTRVKVRQLPGRK